MLIGILADTHDRLEPTVSALKILKAQGAGFLIHCGDVGSGMILDELAKFKCAIVWGNNDWDCASLTRYAEERGIRVLGNCGRLTLEGKTFLVAHGDRTIPINDAIENQDCDYILHGHTHVRRDQKIGRIQVINPGALHRTARRTVATLEPVSGDLAYFFVD